ncbi:MAG: hypothetical protein B6D77_00930 [gamma proteobacterium symbiont of Ctena orbiculata]|nr:MAG: hypothetical protein B6D77_00930 [gamma proteobacterium symbiont of Ctena orbiculata]
MKGSGRILVSASFSLLLAMQGCGGGGGSSDDPADTNNPVNDDNVSDNTSDDFTGNESEAVVNDSNAKDLAIGAASAVKQGVDENGIVLPAQTAAKAYNPTPIVVPMGTSDSSEDLCPHGGTGIVEFNDTTGQVTLGTFTDCSYGGGLYLYTFTGVVTITYADGSDGSAFTSVHDGDLTSVDNITRAIHRTFSCEANYQNCTLFSDFLGFDERSYRVTDISVTEDGNSAYTAEGRVYDPSHGYIDVTTDIPVTFDCTDGHPGTGRLSFTGANQTSGTIEFVSCTEYVVTTNSGTSNSYNW